MRLKILAAVAVLASAALVGVAAPATAGPVLESTVIGHSVLGRPIVAYHLGAASGRPKTLLIGQIHGDEHAGVTLAWSILRSTRSVEDINLWVVPTMNPDGDAAHTRQNAHGVDLNRNWPYKWEPLTGKYYSGPHPLSEPESQAMEAFLLRLHPSFLLVLHQPLYAVDGTGSTPQAAALRTALSRNLGLPISSLNCWSICHGTMVEWYAYLYHAIAVTVEFGWHPTTAYLTGRARDGILSAIGGRWGDLARHNPWTSLTATPHAGGAHVGGWAFDQDFSGRPITYTILNNERFYARYTTSHPSPVVNARYGIVGNHTYSFWLPMKPGKHTVCMVFHNVGAGTANSEPCRTVEVPA